MMIKKSNNIILLFFISMFPYLKVSAQVKMSDAERSVLNCGAVVGTCLEMAYRQQPVMDITAHVDTLYNYLYENPVEINTSLKYFGKIYLQAFFAMSNDKRTDYREIEKCLAVTGKHDIFYTFSFILCAYNYAIWADKQGYEDKALAACQYGMKAHDKLYPQADTPFSEMMTLYMLETHFKRREWKSAEKYSKKLLAMDIPPSEDCADPYIEYMSTYAFCASMAGDKDAAKAAYQKLIKHVEEKNGNDSILIDLLLSNADMFVNEHDDGDRLFLLQKADSIVSANDKNASYLEVKKSIMDYHVGKKDYAKASDVFDNVMNYFEKNKNASLKDIIDWIPFCSMPTIDKGSERINRLVTSNKEKNPLLKAIGLGMLHADSHDYKRLAEQKEVVRQLVGSLDDEELYALTPNLLQFSMYINDFDNAAKYSRIQLSTVEKLTGKDSELYLETLVNMANIYSLKKDYLTATLLYDEALAKPAMTDDLRLQVELAKAADLFFIGDFDSSNSILENILSRKNDKDKILTAYELYALNLIGELDIKTNDSFEEKNSFSALTDKLLEVTRKSCELSVELYGDSHTETIERRLQLCAGLYFKNDKKSMLDEANACRTIIEKEVKNKNISDTYLESIAFYLSEAGDKQAAYEILHDVVQEILAQKISDESAVALYAQVLYDLDNKKGARNYMGKAMEMMTDKVKSGMTTLTSRERMYYWRLYQHMLANTASMIDENDNTFSQKAYDLALFSKGLLLSSDISFVNAVKNTRDPILIEQMVQMRQMREKALQSRDINGEERKNIMEQAARLEKEVMRGIPLPEIKDDITWRDVQSCLPAQAIAIEIIEYQKPDHTAMYGAFLLEKDMAAPLFKEIGTKNETDSVLSAQWQKGAAIELWNSLLESASDVRQVYFAPVGIFHTIPIESAGLLSDNNSLSDKKVYRLSSTREIARKTNKPHTSKVLLIGDLDYNAKVDSTSKSDLVVDETNHATERARGMTKTLNELPNTEFEIENISQVLEGSGTKANTLKKDKGTELAFRNLSGQQIDILHIATHGAYYGNPSQAISRLGIKLQTGNMLNEEDASMTMNLLYFAGANNTLRKSYAGGYDNDGIVSSLDISSMDFNSVDLVSLSACQSGLGKTTSDGLLGLQRGFKKAGAKSILMSLWSVDDEATMLLMTEFYKQLSLGKSKYESLETAKKFVRNDGKHSDTKYWAAFVLLDGID